MFISIFSRNSKMPMDRFVFILFMSGSIVMSCAALKGEEVSARQANAVPYEIEPIEAPFPMLKLERPEFPDRVFNIRDFGAIERTDDPRNMITDATHQAIEAASRAGGGTVLVPAGNWLSAPIHLKSNINLHFEEGATVYFSENRDDYLPVVRQRHEGVEALNYSSLIYASNVRNVAITGKGILDGQGDQWWEWYREHGTPPRAVASKVPLSRRDFGKGSGMEGMRPNFIVFLDSEDILIEGITLNDGPMWNIHLIYSERAIVRDVTVNSLRAPNGDGMVIDSSKDVLIEYNHFETGDDAVVIKSGLNEEGLEINIPTENVVVRNFTARDVRTGSGGVVFGSETSGGIRNIYVHDAVFDGSDRGIRFKTERGRGNATENIYIRNVRMTNITYEAINFNTFYTGPNVTGPAPLIRNIDIRDVHIDGVRNAIVLIGLPEKWLENIHLENIHVENSERGMQLTRVKNLTMNNVFVRSQQRAMTVHDAYELQFDGLKLEDSTGGLPLLIGGSYTGAIIIGDFLKDMIEFTDELTSDVIKETFDTQAW